MATFEILPIGILNRTGDGDANTFVVNGIQSEPTPKAFSYSYGVYNLATLGGDDVVYLYNLTAIDPSGVNPRARQSIDLGDGNDFAFVSSITAATIFGGDGNDTITKVDLRASTTGYAKENNGDGIGAPPTPYFSADGLSQDPAWTDFDIIDGGAGDDIITTGNGPDWVYGGTGNDTISLGSGNNVAYGGDGDDVIFAIGLTQIFDYGGSLSNPRAIKYAPSSNAIWGGDGNDTITVSAVIGMDGIAAAVNGEGGDDYITISAVGGSWVTGGSGNDTIQTSSLVVSFNGNGQAFGAGSDTVWGDDGDDIIMTERGNDFIVGGTGHDWIFAGTGNDIIYGGPGSGIMDGETDRFSFDSYTETSFGTTKNVDTIYDFEPGSRFGGQVGRGDIIDLAALFAQSSSDALVYDAGNPFLQGELRLVASGSDTWVQANDGVGGWDTFLVLIGVTTGELNTTDMADISGGLAAATGGDFLWYTG